MQTKNRREQLMQAAIAIFAERGYAGTRMDDIARAVGIGKSTVYEYFPSKQALLSACGQQFLDNMTAQVQQIFAGPGSLRARIEAYEHLSMHTLSGMHGNIFRHGGSMEAVQIAQQCVEENVHKMIDIIGNALLEGQEKGELSDTCDLPALTMLLMGLPQVCCNPIMKNDENALARLVDFVYQAAKK